MEKIPSNYYNTKGSNPPLVDYKQR